MKFRLVGRKQIIYQFIFRGVSCNMEDSEDECPEQVAGMENHPRANPGGA